MSRAVVDEEIGFPVVAIEHCVRGMACLTLHSYAVGAARSCFRHVARAETVCRVAALHAGSDARFFDDPVDHLVGKPIEFNRTPAINRTKDWPRLALELGHAHPSPHCRDRTSMGVRAWQDADQAPRTGRIRLTAAHEDLEPFLLKAKISQLQHDDLGASKAAGKAQEDDRLVADRPSVERKRLAQLEDIGGAQCKRPFLALAVSPANAIERTLQRRMLGVESDILAAMCRGHRRDVALSRLRPQPSAVAAAIFDELGDIEPHMIRIRRQRGQAVAEAEGAPALPVGFAGADGVGRGGVLSERSRDFIKRRKRRSR